VVGHVNEDGEPILVLPIAGQMCRAVIDTGFNGDLELPEYLRPALNPRFHETGLSILASGQCLEEDYYLIDFPFDGQFVEAQVTFAASNYILIGTHLLRRHRLEINFVAQTVLLERVA
jgi:predicted aspartyl protease